MTMIPKTPETNRVAKITGGGGHNVLLTKVFLHWEPIFSKEPGEELDLERCFVVPDKLPIEARRQFTALDKIEVARLQNVTRIFRVSHIRSIICRVTAKAWVTVTHLGSVNLHGVHKSYGLAKQVRVRSQVRVANY
ncbi:hypothetical protein EE612_031670 [Oryza sativa]|nr:hypothetical protein EE612_031670 [Oryza sativa]